MLSSLNQRYVGGADDMLMTDVRAARPAAVVNCLGVVSASLISPAGLIVANALLPQELAATLGALPMIHASTDCVFDGRRGWYEVGEHPNATDAYGLSKRLGEHCVHDGAVVLRTSIVGLPSDSGRGLLGWFMGRMVRLKGGSTTCGTASRPSRGHNSPPQSWKETRTSVQASTSRPPGKQSSGWLSVLGLVSHAAIDTILESF